MKNYLLHYVQTLDGKEVNLYWRCKAEDYNHAVEQLEDSVKSEGESLVFHELLECEK